MRHSQVFTIAGLLALAPSVASATLYGINPTVGACSPSKKTARVGFNPEGEDAAAALALADELAAFNNGEAGPPACDEE